MIDEITETDPTVGTPLGNSRQFTPKAPSPTADPAERPRNHGAQQGNTNARRHGLYSIRRQVAEVSPDDHDSELARGMAEVRKELANELGGLEALSAQQILVLDEIARVKVYRDTSTTISSR